MEERPVKIQVEELTKKFGDLLVLDRTLYKARRICMCGRTDWMWKDDISQPSDLSD